MAYITGRAKKMELIPDIEATAIDALKQKMVELEREAIDKAIIKAMVIPGEIPLEESSARQKMLNRLEKAREEQINQERERQMRVDAEYINKLEYFTRLNPRGFSSTSVMSTTNGPGNVALQMADGNLEVFDEWAEFQKWKANQRKEKELAAKPLQKPTRLIDLE